MTIKELVSHIAKVEGRKHEASVGDIKEILGILSDVTYADLKEKRPSKGTYTIAALYRNGERRAKRKAK